MSETMNAMTHSQTAARTGRHAMKLIITALALAVISACQTAPQRTQKQPEPQPQLSPMEQLTANRSTAEAIAALDQAALTAPREQAFAFRIKAAELAIEANRLSDIGQRIEELLTLYPEADKIVTINLLQARIHLARKQPEEALNTLKALPANLRPQQQAQRLDLKAKALTQAGFPVESTHIRIELDQLLHRQTADTTLVKANDHDLWTDLMQVNPEIITSQISEIPDTFSGWLELAHAVHSHRYQPTQLNQQIDAWAARHPDHPAQRHIIDTLRQRQIATSQYPQRVLLALPLTGKLANVGQAIRDGLLTAYFNSADALGIHFQLDIVDTAGDPDLAEHAIQQANGNGTKFIIGPLSKEAVSRVSSMTNLQVPVLALNQGTTEVIPTQAPGTSNASVFHLHLAPEEEARQAAERASLDERGYAMVIAPENLWGTRLYEAFAQRFGEIGGQVVASKRYQRGAADFSPLLQDGLNLTNSKVRHRQLESQLHEDLEFTPRRRADIDMIFLAASPQEARQIKPQLDFFYAADIPVYATSHVYTGKPAPKQDKDMNGIRFCDMPWVLQDKPAPGSLAWTIRSKWPGRAEQLGRFFALGIDAYHLVPYLPWLQEHPSDSIVGHTGRLSLNADNSIQRKLQWASFENGGPKLETLSF